MALEGLRKHRCLGSDFRVSDLVDVDWTVRFACLMSFRATLDTTLRWLLTHRMFGKSLSCFFFSRHMSISKVREPLYVTTGLYYYGLR